MEEDVKGLVVFPVDTVVMNEFEKLVHLLPGNGKSGFLGVVDHPGKLKAERILNQDVIVHSHLKGRSQDAANRFNGA